MIGLSCSWQVVPPLRWWCDMGDRGLSVLVPYSAGVSPSVFFLVLPPFCRGFGSVDGGGGPSTARLLGLSALDAVTCAVSREGPFWALLSPLAASCHSLSFPFCLLEGFWPGLRGLCSSCCLGCLPHGGLSVSCHVAWFHALPGPGASCSSVQGLSCFVPSLFRAVLSCFSLYFCGTPVGLLPLLVLNALHISFSAAFLFQIRLYLFTCVISWGLVVDGPPPCGI